MAEPNQEINPDIYVRKADRQEVEIKNMWKLIIELKRENETIRSRLAAVEKKKHK